MHFVHSKESNTIRNCKMMRTLSMWSLQNECRRQTQWVPSFVAIGSIPSLTCIQVEVAVSEEEKKRGYFNRPL